MMNGLTIILMVTGFFFFFATTIGLIRFPDLYTRMHAAGKGDALSSLLMILGMALYVFNTGSFGDILVVVKLIFIIVFIFLTSPTATHAIIDAGFESGVDPWTKGKEGK